MFTIGTQLTELIRHHAGGSRAGARRRAVELLSLVRLANPEQVLSSYPHQLSGGMAQRVAIARALAGRPRLLIADEPTTALDVTVQAEILDLLRLLRDTQGLSVLLVTHDWGVVADLCDRAVVMYAGEVVEQGESTTLFRAPRHPYTRALLDANPASTGFRRKLPAIPGTVPPPGERPVGCTFASRCPRRQPDCTTGPVPVSIDPSGHAYRCLHPRPTAPMPTPDAGPPEPGSDGATSSEPAVSLRIAQDAPSTKGAKEVLHVDQQ